MPTFDALYSEVEAEESKFDSLFSDVDREEKEQTAANVQKFGVEQPMQAVSAIQSALPVGLGVQSRLQRKEALREATQEARTAGKVGRFVQGAVETAEQAAEALTPSGLMNQPARLLGKPDVFHPGAPLIQIPRNPAFEGTAVGGVANVALGAIESMTTPEMIVTAPAMAASALARGAMAFEMARNIPEQVAQSAQTLATPESTAQEKVEAIGGPLLGAFFAGALARGHVQAPKEIPALRGRALEQPAGAQAPRIEAPLEIQRATPAEAAQTATRMQRTATAAYEAPRAKRVQVPEYSTPLAEQGRMPEEMPPPAVQPEAPRPREIATWDDAVSAVRDRAKGTETREQIQALLPEITISREGAAELARTVFGENWKPGGAERAPGPKPVEGLTPREQEILAKARTTTMTAEERALADRMMAGELERPSEAPQAPVVERPNERIEVQRKGQEEGQGEVAQPEPAPAAQEPTPAPSPMPEAAKAPEPVQPAPLTASMESARAVLAMTPAEFAQRAKSFNKTNLELGQKVSDAELAELEQLGIQAEQRWTQAKRRAEREKTPEAMNEMMALSSMPQYFNEAIAEARRIRERTPNVAKGEGRLESDQPQGQESGNVQGQIQQGQGPATVATGRVLQEPIPPKAEPVKEPFIHELKDAEIIALAEDAGFKVNRKNFHLEHVRMPIITRLQDLSDRGLLDRRTIAPKAEPSPSATVEGEAPKPAPSVQVAPSKPAESPLNAKVASLKSQLENVSAQYEEARNASLTAETSEATREAREKAEELKYQKTEIERQLRTAQGDATIENWRAERKAIPAEAPSGTVKVTAKDLKAQKENLSEQVNNAIKNPPQGQTVLFDVPGDGSFKIKNTPEALKTFKTEILKQFPTTAPKPPGQSRPGPAKASSPAQIREAMKPEELRTIAKDFMSSDPTRKAINYAYSDGTQIVATDGRRLLRVVSDKAPGTPLDPVRIDASGKVIPGGEVGGYPLFEQIIPRDAELIFGGADTGQLFHIAKQAKVFADTMPETKGERVVGLELFINKDRSIGARMRIEGDEFSHNIQPDAYAAGSYNPDYLVDSLNAIRRLGSEKVDILVSGDTGPMVMRGMNAEAVIMPVNLSMTGGVDIRQAPSKARGVAGKAVHGILPEPMPALEPVEMARFHGLGEYKGTGYYTEITGDEIRLGITTTIRGEPSRRIVETIQRGKDELNQVKEWIAKTIPEQFRAKATEYAKNALKVEKQERKAAQEAMEARRQATKAKEKPADPIGMGGAVSSEFERQSKSPMTMRVAEINKARVDRGLEPLVKPETVHDQDVLNRAIARLDENPAAGEQLVEAIEKDPTRVISDEDTHLLLLERINIWDERNKAASRARQAYEDSKQFPNRLADVAVENERTQYWANRLDRLEKVSRLAARAKGLSLRSQRIMVNEDFTLEAMEMRALQARNFRELPPEEAAKEKADLTKLAEEHKAKSDALTKRIEELEAEAIMREAQAKKADAQAYHPRVIEMAETYAKKWDERGKKALEELRSIFTSTGEGKLFSGAPIGPEVIDKLAIYGISKLVRGAVDLAKWTDAMVKDIGEGFRPYAEQVWKEANARLEKDLTASESKFGRDANAVKTAIKTGGATAVVTPDSIIARMQRSRAKNPKSNLSTLARKLARLYVEQGVKDRNVLIDKVHEGLKQVDPAITRRGTMETLSGYGEYSMLPKDQVSVILRDLQGQMQQILKLEDMAGGKAPKRTGRERRTPSDEERRLQMRVEEAKRRGGYTVTSPETQLRTALDEVKKRLQNQIADLELQIQTKAKIVKERTPVQEDAETQQLRAKRDELKAQFDEIFSEPMTDAQRLEAWKERTRDRIEEAQGILEGTRQRKPKRSELEMDSEALRLRYDLHQIERQIREREVAEKMANRPTYQKVIGEIGETANTIRALMTSFDFSAPLRQGLILTAAHPVRSAVAFPEMFRAAFSAEKAFGQAEALRNRPNAPLYESSGLYLAEHGGRLSTMEEAFMSRRAEKLPVIGRGIRASQRAYTSYLNRIRADSFDAMVKGLTKDGRGNPAELKAIANFINVATGRGSVAWNQAATTLNTVFFAPRYVASRFEYLAGQPLYKGTARTRKMIVKEYGRFLAGAAAVYALAQAAGGEVGTDPNSGDFGKIKIGNTRIDPMAGLLQATVLASRVGSIYANKLGLAGVPKQKGKPLEIDKVLLNFLRGKLAPVPGLVVSFGKGAYPGGEKVTPANLAGSVFPISWQDIYEATKDQGVPAGLALGILSIFGTGVQTYEQDRR